MPNYKDKSVYLKAGHKTRSHSQRFLPCTWRQNRSEQIKTGEFLSIYCDYITATTAFFFFNRLHMKPSFPKAFGSSFLNTAGSQNGFVTCVYSICPIYCYRSASVKLVMSQGKMPFILLYTCTETQLTYELTTISIMDCAHYQITLPTKYQK